MYERKAKLKIKKLIDNIVGKKLFDNLRLDHFKIEGNHENDNWCHKMV